MVKRVVRVPFQGTGLQFSRYTPFTFEAAGFRKVIPRADALERGELEFVGLDRRPAHEVAEPQPETEDA